MTMYYSQPPLAGSLTTAASLLAWTPGNDPANVASVPLASRGGMPAAPRMMIMGPGPTPGFDLLSQGGSNQDIFNFDRWQYVDIMAFGQTTFAIPPVVWINACHRNGVLALGGIFTYWQPSFDDFYTLMADAATATQAASQLAAIAQYYGFDGYLVDIEYFTQTSNVDQGATIDATVFQTFLSTLRAALQGNSPASFLMYYDTINAGFTPAVVDGYCNELGPDNQMFFQDGATIVSDGIFPNYHWDDCKLDESAKLATALGRSPLDVYMGTDVGVYGSRTWERVRDSARKNLSAALWSATAPFSNRTDEVSFQSLMDELWGTGLDPKTGLAAVIAARPVPAALPFCTTFNQGQGRQFYWPLHGTQTYGGSDWNNLSLQDVATSYNGSVWTAAGKPDAFTLDVSYDLAFDGGSLLLLAAGSDLDLEAFSVIDLYRTAWPMANGLEAAYAVSMAEHAESDVAIGLLLDDPDNTLLLLAPPSSSPFSAPKISGHDVVPVTPSSTTAITAPSTQGGAEWTVRSYDSLPATYGAYNVVEVLAVARLHGIFKRDEGAPQLYLGQLVVTESGGLATAPGSVTGLAVESQWVTLPQGPAAVNLQLSWTPPATGTVRAYDLSYTYTIAGNTTQVWLGRTTNTIYFVDQLYFPVLGGQAYTTELQLVVQVIGGNGVEQSVADAASVPFSWTPPS